MVVVDWVVMKIFSHEYVVMKIEWQMDVVMKTWLRAAVVTNNFLLKLLGNSWLHE